MPRNILITGAQNIFIKPSVLNDLRRRGTALLEQKRAAEYLYTRKEFEKTSHPYPVDELDFTCNVSNSLARRFYERHGVKTIEPAFELNSSAISGPLMKTKLCLKYETGICPAYHTNSAETGALFLTDGKNRYTLDFRCGDCVMKVYTFFV
jgi:putative protease